MKAPYESFEASQLILRDFLAVDRTILANERTLLAYVRTALGALLAGISLIKFFDSIALNVVGWSLILSSIGILGKGAARFVEMKRCIKRVGQRCTKKTG